MLALTRSHKLYFPTVQSKGRLNIRRPWLIRMRLLSLVFFGSLFTSGRVEKSSSKDKTLWIASQATRQTGAHAVSPLLANTKHRSLPACETRWAWKLLNSECPNMLSIQQISQWTAVLLCYLMSIHHRRTSAPSHHRRLFCCFLQFCWRKCCLKQVWWVVKKILWIMFWVHYRS
jgi:hypothetical protein